MNRRHFLLSASAVSAGFAFSKRGLLFAGDAPSSSWRTFEVTTRVEVLNPSGTTRIWAPAALITQTPFQKTISNAFNAEGGSAKTLENRADALGIISAEFASGVSPILTVTSRVTTKNYQVDLSTPGKAPKEAPAELENFLRPTKLLPTDGIVKETSLQITKGAKTDVEKARAIYEWIVENTFR